MPKVEQIKLKGPMITAAEALIEARNFSMENLAQALDCGLSEIVKAVGQADDLVLEVNSRTLDRLLASDSLAVSRTAQGVDRVVSLCMVLLRFTREHKARIQLLFQHPFPSNYRFPGWYLAQVRDYFAPLEQTLATMAPARSKGEVDLAARALWSQVLGVLYLDQHELASLMGVIDPEVFVTLNVETFLRGWVA